MKETKYRINFECPKTIYTEDDKRNWKKFLNPYLRGIGFLTEETEQIVFNCNSMCISDVKIITRRK